MDCVDGVRPAACGVFVACAFSAAQFMKEMALVRLMLRRQPVILMNLSWL